MTFDYNAYHHSIWKISLKHSRLLVLMSLCPLILGSRKLQQKLHVLALLFKNIFVVGIIEAHATWDSDSIHLSCIGFLFWWRRFMKLCWAQTGVFVLKIIDHEYHRLMMPILNMNITELKFFIIYLKWSINTFFFFFLISSQQKKSQQITFLSQNYERVYVFNIYSRLIKSLLQSEDEEDEVSIIQFKRAVNDGIITLWPDEDTRVFYECRMELRELLPSILFEVSTWA